MTDIFLHGILSKKFKKKHTFKYLGKPYNFINAIESNHKGFKKAVLDLADKGMFFEIIFDGEKVDSFGEMSKDQTVQKIDIVPCICGHGWTAFFVSLAINLVMAGIMYLLTPEPEGVEPRDVVATLKINSFLFSTEENTTLQGINVPLGYGRLRIGTKVVGTEISYVKIEDYSMERFLLGRVGPNDHEGAPTKSLKVQNLGFN
jgi:predicted phage tail protein